MISNDLPSPLKLKIRSFFYNAQHLERAKHFNALMDNMSPDLRGEVALILNAAFLEKLPIVTRCHEDERHNVVTSLAVALASAAYPPQENIMKPGQLATEVHIIKRGVIAVNKSSIIPPSFVAEQVGSPAAVPIDSILASINQEILTQGMSFGNDMILTDARRRYSAVSLTFCEVHILTKVALSRVFSENYFPKTAKNLRQYAIKMALQIKFVQAARVIHAKERKGAALKRQKRNGSRARETNDAAAASQSARSSDAARSQFQDGSKSGSGSGTDLVPGSGPGTESVPLASAATHEPNETHRTTALPAIKTHPSSTASRPSLSSEAVLDRIDDVVNMLEDISGRLKVLEDNNNSGGSDQFVIGKHPSQHY
jgi:CRP-like cAMP-binding protein